MRFTPENIVELPKDSVFVFGSNMLGSHGGGAAKYAKDHFGAEEGVCEGLTGLSWAFPTLNSDMAKRSFIQLRASKENLYKYAINWSEWTFLVTKVGCGIAGFTVEEMRDVFQGPKPGNVTLPKEFES